MNQQEQFRNELKKLMPGYKWTVHKPIFQDSDMVATGTQASGSNRLSTLQVTLTEAEGAKAYEVKSAGYGAKAPWKYATKAATVAQAFRLLQTHYESAEQEYRALANALQCGRKA